MRFKPLDDVPDAVQERHPGSAWVVWRPTPRGQRWLVRIDFGINEGRVVSRCIGIEVRSFREKADDGWPSFLPLWNEDAAELQRRTLRDVPLGQILDDLGENLLEIHEQWAKAFRVPTGHAEEDAAAIRDAEQVEQYVAYHRARSPRRQGRGVPDLEAIAQVYLAARAARRPATAAVAKWGSVSESTAAKWIMRVRRETQFLPPPTNAAKRQTGKKS